MSKNKKEQVESIVESYSEPYTRVEWIHGKKHKVVGFSPDDEVSGFDWVESESPSRKD